MIGIYKIEHIPTGEYYIGSSSNIGRRFAEHKYKFTHFGKFDCGWVTTDKNILNYEFSVIAECSLDELHYMEVDFINAADPAKCKNVRADDSKCSRSPNMMCGKHWYTNGTETIICFDEDAPTGWYRGRSSGIYGIKNLPKDNIKKGTVGYEHFLVTKSRYQNYIDTTDMDIQILSNGEFVPMNGILVNSSSVSNPLCEVRYSYKGMSTKSLALTIDHPLVTKRGRVKVEDLVPGDIIFDSVDGSEYPITEIIPIDTKSPTYDVETDNDVFDLSGILSHNCRTRLIGNINGPEQTTGRGNFAFHTLNLPRLAIETHIAVTDYEERRKMFFEKLDALLEDAKGSLLDRFALIGKKTYENFPFTMQQGLYLTSDDKPHAITDTIGEVLKQGSLSIGYVGLAETMTLLTGKTFGIDHDIDAYAQSIIQHIYDFCKKCQKETHLNWSCFATPAEATAGRFATIDNNLFGKEKKLDDVDKYRIFGKGYYTNSHMMDFSLNTSLENKIKTEAPFHAITNAGHIFYYKLNGDLSKNLPAVLAAVDAMYEGDLGYFTVTMDSDTCLKCKFHGIIDNECPCCGEKNEKYFIRVRRITGYLTGAPMKSITDAWNDGKLKELADRNNI